MSSMEKEIVGVACIRGGRPLQHESPAVGLHPRSIYTAIADKNGDNRLKRGGGRGLRWCIGALAE